MAFKENQMIEKLNNSNFSIWKFKISMLLIKEDLDSHLTGEPPDPITEDWRKADNKARALINLFLDDNQIVHIKHLTTAKSTWDTLTQIHERKTLSSKLYLLRNLYSAKLDEKGNMITHITRILEIIDKLKSIGEDIGDSHLSALLLCSLPPSYDTLVTALEARPEDELTPEFIKNKLTDEYNRRLGSYNKNTENSNKAFQAHKKSFHPQNAFRKDAKYCSNCKKKGHLKSDCWYLNKGKYNNNNFKPNKPKPNNNTSMCVHNDRKQINEIKKDETDKQLATNLQNLAFLTTGSDPDLWVIDSGSSSHICNNRELFSKFDETTESQVVIANGCALTSYGIGNINLTSKISGNTTNNITLKHVLYVPQIQANLLSVKQAASNGCKIIFQQNSCQLIYNNKVHLEGTVSNNLYQVKLTKNEETAYTATVQQCNSPNCISLWHRRLGHRSIDAIKLLSEKNLADNITLNNCKHTLDCETCVKSKLTDKPYPKQAQNRRTKVLELIHSDICGPFPTETIGGKKYLLTFVDDFSRFTTIFLLSKKSEVLEKLKEFVNSVKTKFGRVPKSFRNDNAGEYDNDELNQYFKDMGIKHEFSVAYCSPQNGVSERKNRSLVEMTRTMLNEANVNKALWGEAMHTANYLQNRLPTKATTKTPYELWNGKKPNLENLKVFGCKAFSYIHKSNRKKLEDRAQEVIFVGYDQTSKGYRVCTKHNVVTIARTVKFFENSNLDKIQNETNEVSDKESENQNPDIENNHKFIEIDLDTPSGQEIPSPDTDSTNPQTQIIRRSERQNRGVPPDRFSYMTKPDNKLDPGSWEEVIMIKDPKEKQNWIEATNEEIKSLKQNNTWTLTEPPENKKTIGCRWTFKSKTNQNGEIEKYKARLVAKGYSQKYGEDFFETYAPVVSYTTIRALLLKAANEKLKVNHLDIKTAFLHGELKENIFMTQPEGYIEAGKENQVCKLNKAIYGLKQAARAWHTKIADTLIKLNFTASETEQCLFKKTENNDTMYIIVYVDDLLVAGKQNQIDELVNKLEQEYEIKNLGEVKYYLGIEIRKTKEGNYALSQKLKISELIKTHKLQEAKPCNTPLEPGYTKSDDEDNILPNNHKYRQAIGSLLYISNICRPDICAAVNILSRKVERPREKDWNQVKRVIKYLKTTIDYELHIKGSLNSKLITYADADWGGDTSDRKSTSGNLFLIDTTPIMWTTKKQSSVALSSAEAEYIAASAASQDILWLLKILNDLDLSQQLPVTMYEDNQSTIKMTESGKDTCKTKHISIKFHHIKTLCENGTIHLTYCPTKEMTADILTKGLPKPDFIRHRKSLQVLPKGDLEFREEC